MAKKKVFQIGHALTEGMEETITAVQQFSGEMHIEVVPLKRIELDPENPRDLLLSFNDVYLGLTETDDNYTRKLDELQSLQTIANSIREQGLINPIVVYKFGDKYRLVAGERRTLASVIAGKKDIQAKILESKPNELKIRLLQWIENVERSDLTLWERLRNLEKITESYARKKDMRVQDVTITEISQLLGCSKPHAINYKSALLADEKIKQLIKENKIKNLEKASLVASIESVEIRQKVLSSCLAGTPLKRMRLIVEQETRQLNRRQQPTKSSRGRHAQSIHFGATKSLAVAKMILSAIATHPHLAPLFSEFPVTDWQGHQDYQDYQSMNAIFKQLIKKIEINYL